MSRFRRWSLLVLLVAVASGVSVRAFAQTRIYLTEYQYNNPKIKSMNLDGSGVVELFTPPASDWLLVGCGADPVENRIYWTHGSTPGTIRRAFLDGSGGQLCLSGLKLPRGISLDRVHRKIYWTQSPTSGNASGLVRRAGLDGTGPETVYALTPYDPVFSYVGKPWADGVNGYVYFGAAQEIRRVRIDGGGSAETLVRGVNTVTAVAVDAAAGKIYFLDANTNSDYLGCARLDGTGFTVLADISPGVNQSSGLFDLRIDPAAGSAWFTDEIAGKVRRCALDGSGLTAIYTSPAGLSPTGICFDTEPAQPILDCNGNGIRDLDDVSNGTSQDCNGNGVPDECEDDPCRQPQFLVDQGSDPVPPGRTVSGGSTGYDVFQPFEFASAPGTFANVQRIALDGWTVNYDPAGFRATLLPDNGTGTFPDETAPIRAADLQYRFSPDSVAWVGADFQATLEPGRYWVRLTANAAGYQAAANVGVRGEHSISRRHSDGGIVPSSYSIALRIETGDASAVPEPPAGWAHDGDRAGNVPAVRLACSGPNPFCTSTEVAWVSSRPGTARIEIFDASGRRIRTMHQGAIAAGRGTAAWDGTDDFGRPVVSGACFARLTVEGRGGGGAGSVTAAVRLILLR